ncbi:pentapeptide repeat-containing protein [Helicobacter cinaedi]|uniref:pentapeptide repeat-containing protein n=1 Tax=Helicobacter cinaedi TaxID=213 RepID=UPI001E2BFC97|nr:pentapeptide repeat-containing protein [Helicobacter cinaedi]
MNDIKEKIADYINQHKSNLLYDIDHRSIEQSVMGLINGNKAAGNILNIDDTTIKERVYKEIGQQETKQALQIKEEGVVVYSQNSFVVSPRPAVYHDNGTTQPPQQQERLQINSFDVRILSKYNLIFRECEFNAKLLAHYDFKCHSATFKNCIFKKRVDFSNAKFCNDVYFNNSHFKGYADFHECEFEKTACFYGATFEKSPNFSQAIFKENLNFVNVKCDFDFENLKESIKQAKEKEQDSKKTLDKFANDFRDSFRLIKNALIKDNNLLDASNFHKYELYCKEIELDSKNPKIFSKDWIDKIQLCFYRKLCNHHTDLILNLKWLVITIGLFTILFFASKIIQGKEILNLNHYGIALSASSCIMIVLLCLFDYLKLLGGFAYLNLVATLWLVCYNPKLIFGVVNILGDSCFNSFENIVMVTYTIMMFLVVFSLQKTARKNSIIPH